MDWPELRRAAAARHRPAAPRADAPARRSAAAAGLHGVVDLAPDSQQGAADLPAARRPAAVDACAAASAQSPGRTENGTKTPPVRALRPASARRPRPVAPARSLRSAASADRPNAAPAIR